MTKEQKWWFESGKQAGQLSPFHPDQFIQEVWGYSIKAKGHIHFNESFNQFSAWAAGVKKGSKYFENN